jgi:ABC-type nitrate/sulfonate/bicarbonate transport system substrate-binding protein
MPSAAGVVALLLLALSAPGDASAQGPAPGMPVVPVLRYGQAASAAKTIFSIPVVVAQREGLFQREGLDFRVVIPIPGGADKMIDALHDDTVDMTHVATTFLVRAALAGSDAVAIAAEFNNPIYSLIAKPDITRISDLKGKVVGMADPGTSISISMRKLFAKHGLRERDVRFKHVEGTSTRLNCMRRGDCIAAPLGQPHDLLALAEGYRLLALSTEVTPEFVYTVTAVRRSWALANQDTVLRYVRALSAAFGVIRDPRRRDAVIKAITDTTGVNAAIAERTLALYFEPERKVLPQKGEIDLKGLAQVIAFMGEAGHLKAPLPAPERFVDLQYLKRAGIQ